MSEVRLLKPCELNMSDQVQIYEDGLRTEEKSGNYEWWYFDSKYPDGSSLVIVFFTKHVTSFGKKFRPYVSLDYVNPDGREVHTVFTSEDYSFSREKCNVRIGDCYIRGDLKHYDIYFRNDEAECSISMDGSVPSWRPESGHIYFGKKDFFAWLPSVPEGVVKGTLTTKNKTISLAGTGYHDHNWGNKLMILLMNDWYLEEPKSVITLLFPHIFMPTKKMDTRLLRFSCLRRTERFWQITLQSILNTKKKILSEIHTLSAMWHGHWCMTTMNLSRTSTTALHTKKVMMMWKNRL